MKSINLQVTAQVWEQWKSKLTKARNVFERGLEYDDLIAQKTQMLAAAAEQEKRHEEAVDKLRKAQNHLLGYNEANMEQIKVLEDKVVSLNSQLDAANKEIIRLKDEKR